MPSPSHRAFFWIYILVLAPIGAVVVVAVLLLFGVPPHTVFAPGFAVKSILHAPKSVGVLATLGMWWAIFAAAGWAWERRREPGS